LEQYNIEEQNKRKAIEVQGKQGTSKEKLVQATLVGILPSNKFHL